MNGTDRNCPPDETLVGFVSNLLDPATKAAVESHLAGCRRCREEAHEIAQGLSDGSAEAVPPGLAERVLASLPAAARKRADDGPAPAAPARSAPRSVPFSIRLYRGLSMSAAASLLVLIGAFFFSSTLNPPKAAAAGNAPGELRAMKEGKFLGFCPLERTEVRAQVSGNLARVEVTQKFGNPYEDKIEAVYVFPLPSEAAVDDMEIKTGKRVVRGEIKRREEARKIYQRAKEAGKVAALLDQERPNIFTQSVANILPGERVDVTIRYTEVLDYKDGEYSFAFPLVVAPRYSPGSPASNPAPGVPAPAPGLGGSGEATTADTARVPDASRLSPPVVPEGTRSGHDVSISVDLDAGVPLKGITSVLHKIDVDAVSPSRRIVTLGGGDTIPNKDFILHYGVAGDRVEDAVLVHRNPVGARHAVPLQPANSASERPAMDGGFFTMILQPPKRPKADEISPKELIFVIDSSGSMQGFPIEKAKETMQLCIEAMNEDDTFNLFAFSSEMGQAFPASVPNTPENRRKALVMLDSLAGGGGTEMMPAIRAALEPAADPKRLRVVCFMTDGQIGNDMEIIGTVRKAADRSRVFSFGIGNSVNRFLLENMAREGRGDCQIVTNESEGKVAARKFTERIRNPVLTDISIDFGGLDVADVYPREIPDVFATGPVVLKGRYRKAGKGNITLKGKVGGKPYERKIPVTLPESEPRNPTLPSLWARARIDDLMAKDWIGAQTNAQRPDLREAVTAVALEFHLMSQYTSFVAVEDLILTGLEKPRAVVVPVEMPEGQSYEGTFGGDGKTIVMPFLADIEAASLETISRLGQESQYFTYAGHEPDRNSYLMVKGNAVVNPGGAPSTWGYKEDSGKDDPTRRNPQERLIFVKGIDAAGNIKQENPVDPSN
ncbi:MAG: VIT domain-containing protein, partial [Planctomycetota bacterium]